MVLTAGVGRAVEEPVARLVRYADGTLTVRAQKQPLEELLREISAQSGAGFEGTFDASHSVTAEFDNLPLAEGLRRLLGDTSFALVYCAGERLCKVRLLAKGEGKATMVITPTPAADPALVAHFSGILDGQEPVPVEGPVTTAVGGGDSASLRQLLSVALTHADPAVRGSAVSAGIRALDSQPELRARLLADLNQLDDRERQGLVTAARARWVREALQQVQSQAKTPEVRSAATGLLRWAPTP